MSRPKSFRIPSGEELTAALIEKVDQRRRLDAEILEILGRMDREHVASEAGYPSLATYISHATRMSKRAAARLMGQSAAVQETVTPTGHVTPAPLPAVRELVMEGAVDGEHIDAITATLKQLPESTPPEVRQIVESTLADTARVCDPLVVRRHGTTLLDRIDPDGHEPDDTVPKGHNELHIRRTRDGGCHFRGRLTTTPTEVLLALLGPHAKPQSPVPGVPDPRSEAERHGDGLDAILALAISSSDNPKHGGEKPHVNLMVDLNHFLDGSGIATADSGTIFSPQTVLQTACDADLIRIVLDKHGAPLNVGRAHRVVTIPQRQALIARDKGCAFPDCHLPPRWTDAHHIIHWNDGGPTDLQNLVLLCRRHHTLLHNTQWTIHMRDGIPWFQPPRWIDPHQTLIRNILRQ